MVRDGREEVAGSENRLVVGDGRGVRIGWWWGMGERGWHGVRIGWRWGVGWLGVRRELG